MLGEDCRAEEGEDVAEPEGGEQQGQRIVYTPVTVIPRPPPSKRGGRRKRYTPFKVPSHYRGEREMKTTGRKS